MFQTDLNHFLQSFASDPLTAFMRFITDLGYVNFFMAFLIILMLAVDFRKGFILFMILLWTALATFILKDYFDLPRPFHVDDTLEFLDGKLPDATDFSFSDRGADGFWDALPADVLEVTRKSDGVEHGFPSGHTSIAIAFWGALMILYRKRWIQTICVVLMILIPLTRIYLGVHFLADVLGGIVLGGVVLGLFYKYLLSPTRLQAFLDRDHYTIGLNTPTILLLLAPLPFLFVTLPRVWMVVAMMIGLGLGYLMLSRIGIPSDEGTIVARIVRTLLGGGAAGSLGVLAKITMEAAGLWQTSWSISLAVFVFFLGLVWVGTEVSVRMGWFSRAPEKVITH